MKADPSEFKTLRTIDEELVIYIVKKDDTIRTISQKYYGKPEKEKAIADFNFIEHGSSLKPGEEIIVDVLPLKIGKAGELPKESFSSSNSSGPTESKKISKKEEEKKTRKKTKKIEKVKISSSKNLIKKSPSVISHPEMDPTCEEGWETFSSVTIDSSRNPSFNLKGSFSQANSKLQADPELNSNILEAGASFFFPAGKNKA